MPEWVSDISTLISRDVPSFRHILKSVLHQSVLPNGNWFYMELTPVSEDKRTVEYVLRDLIGHADSFAVMENGCVMHDEDYEVKAIDLSIDDKRVIQEIRPKTYKVALWEGSTDEKVLQLRYPDFFVLYPAVNHIYFPDHPHLNPAQRTRSGVLMPPALCYELDFTSLGDIGFEQIKNAYIRVCIWLFRHQVWELRKGDPLRRWPGLEFETDQKKLEINRFDTVRTKEEWYETEKSIVQLCAI